MEEYLEVKRYGRKTALKRPARQATWKVYEIYQRTLAKAGKMDWQDVTLLTYQELLKQPLREPFAHVVIDEAQDLTAMQLRVAQRLNKDATYRPENSIFLVGDAAQTLYSRGYAWVQVGLQLRGRSATLRKNFRNTRQIADAAATLLAYNHNLKLSEEYVDPQYTNRLGPWPIVLQCDVTDREQSAVLEKILSLIEDQRFRLSDFAILSPSYDLIQTMQQSFRRVQVPCVIHTDDEFDILEEQVKILTIHSAKGLEFPVIFLLGLHQGVLPRNMRSIDDEEAELDLERERTLMYVGMTRAAEALYLVTSQNNASQFLGEISSVTRFEPFTGGKA
jgi:superfamily I DNA/RNA helicase